MYNTLLAIVNTLKKFSFGGIILNQILLMGIFFEELNKLEENKISSLFTVPCRTW